ncbi:hypothetical protein RYA05_02140 [Pseudomonas syringae pv. actinidiae]|nr:hypothetical protein [Pseudomonas syringae pv. actinidiae]
MINYENNTVNGNSTIDALGVDHQAEAELFAEGAAYDRRIQAAAHDDKCWEPDDIDGDSDIDLFMGMGGGFEGHSSAW